MCSITSANTCEGCTSAWVKCPSVECQLEDVHIYLMVCLAEEEKILQRVCPSHPVWRIRCPRGSEQGRGGTSQPNAQCLPLHFIAVQCRCWDVQGLRLKYMPLLLAHRLPTTAGSCPRQSCGLQLSRTAMCPLPL